MRVETLTGCAVLPWVDRLADLYGLVYAEPPYCEGPEQVARFAAGLPGEAERPGFTAVVAHDGGRTSALAYGWTMPAGVWWSNAVGEPPGEVRGADKLAVMEWMVRPDWRGRGHGARVFQVLLSGRSERWATLASDPRSYARGVYGRRGWRRVGSSRLPWGPLMDLLVLPLG